jgi:hypothetical protein
MAFVKGHKKIGGKKKGSTNVKSVAIKEAFQLAFEGLGGAKGLMEWGKINKTEFYKLASKLIPVDVTSGGKTIYEITFGKNDTKED